jgi:C-terminal processing protease CtpA/Prc
MDRTLPSGGMFLLPNERFTTNGRSYDGRGIPPDIRTEVFTDEELDNGRDSALDRAIDLLKR